VRVVYLPLYADLEPFISHKLAQEATTFKECREDVYWIAGSGLKDEEFDDESRILKLPVEELFENIFIKTFLALKWLLKNVDFDYVVRTNTSTYFFTDRLNSLIFELGSPKILAAGEFGYSQANSDCCVNAGKYLAGTGILLSREMVEKIVSLDYLDLDSESWADDVLLSRLISQLQVPFTHLARVDITDYKPFQIASTYRVKSWYDQDVTVKRFWEIKVIENSPIKERIRKVLLFHYSEFLRYVENFPIFNGLNVLRIVRQIFRFWRFNQDTISWILGHNE